MANPPAIPGVPEPFSRRFDRGAYLLGFGASGFFDGILLHQVLQWHHLLSALPRSGAGDLRFQVMADGWFHAVMYLIALAGSWLLLRARPELGAAGAVRRLFSGFWIGLGVWHVLDAVLSHWMTGIHRIRMDSPHPLAWDLAWVIVFGVLPLLAGWRMRRGNGPPAASSGIGGKGAAMLLVAANTAGAGFNLFPLRAPGPDTVVVALRPGVPAAALLAALDGTEARILWADRSGGVWVLADAAAGTRFGLYRHGAMYVSATLAPAGCSAWVRDGAGRGAPPAAGVYGTPGRQTARPRDGTGRPAA